jgi:acetyltransferase-like isoleucine patch superfamily enzyme
VELWIAGAGGVGREALDVALAADRSVAGFVDDRLAGTEVRRLPVVGPAEVPSGVAFLVAIGDPAARLAVAARLGGPFEALVDPRAIVGPLSSVSAGCLISGGAFVSSSVSLGAHVQVHYNATVGHDCALSEGATAVVTRDVPDGVTVMGSPAKILVRG